jgi:hypothetical protein
MKNIASRLALLLLILIGTPTLLQAQDSLQLDSAVLPIEEKRKERFPARNYQLSNPARAAILSATLPGLGQYYNKKGWAVKVPVIYGIGTTLGFLVLDSHSEYRRFREAYLFLEDGNPLTTPPPSFSGRTSDQILRTRDTHRRNRDFYIIMLLVVYALNVGEATTTAHLNEFDINDDLAIRIKPYNENLQGQSLLGFSLTIPLNKR